MHVFDLRNLSDGGTPTNVDQQDVSPRRICLVSLAIGCWYTSSGVSTVFSELYPLLNCLISEFTS